MTASTPDQRLGGGGVDRDDARVGVRGAQHLYVQHARHHHVAGVLQGARHLARRIDATHVGADHLVVLALVLGQRRGGPGAVHDVARELDGIEDFLVAGAAADIAAEALLDLLGSDERIGADGGRCRHHHARDAVAALAGAGLVERLLHDAQLTGARETFDRLDLGTGDFGGRNEAGFDERAVDEHRAGAALSRAAAFLGAGQVQGVAHEVEQPGGCRHRLRHGAPVDGGFDLEVRHSGPRVPG